MHSTSKKPTTKPLRRMKSTASTGAQRGQGMERPHVRPQTPHEQALSAASRAFETAQVRGQTDRRVHHRASRLRIRPQLGDNHNSSNETSHSLSGIPNSDGQLGWQANSNLERNDSVLSRTTEASSMSKAESFLEHATTKNFTPLDNIASIPSSYRRVRKSRSMFSTRSGLTRGFRYLEDFTPRVADRAFKSSTVVRSKRFATLSTRPEHDLVIQVARDQYLRDIDKQRQLRSRASSIWPSGGLRARNFFKRQPPVDNFTSNRLGAGSPENKNPSPGKTKLGRKARLLSNSLSAKLRRIFLPTESLKSLPPQQLKASRDYSKQHSEEEDEVTPILQATSDDYATVSRSQSRVPSLNVVIARRKARSRPVSDESGQSGEKSRVTSWTDTTSINTIATHKAAFEKSIPPAIIEGAQGYEVFNTPIDTSSRKDRNFGPVDSHNLFTALRRKIDLDETDNHDDVFRLNTSSKRFSSNSSHSGSHNKNTTPPDLDKEPHQHLSDPDAQFEQQYSDFDRKLLHSISQRHFSKPRHNLREVQSTFFPQSVTKSSKATSPYRLAIAQTKGPQRESGSKIYVESDISEYNGPNNSIAGASSVYSRTTGGHSPAASLPRSLEDGHEPGTAVIITGRRVSQNSFSRQRPIRVVYGSPRPSGEWGQWMSDQVAHLSKSDDNIRISRSLLPNGHSRESAQIGSDEFGPAVPQSTEIQPLATVSGNTIPVVDNGKVEQERCTCEPNHKAVTEHREGSPTLADAACDTTVDLSQQPKIAAEANSDFSLPHASNGPKINDFGPPINLRRLRQQPRLAASIKEFDHNNSSASLRHHRSTATMRLRFARAENNNYADVKHDENSNDWVDGY